MWPQPNMTKVAECEELVVQFKAAAQECLDKSVGVHSGDQIKELEKLSGLQTRKSTLEIR